MAAMSHGDFYGHLTDRITRCIIKISLVYAITHGVFEEFIQGTKFTDGAGREHKGDLLKYFVPLLYHRTVTKARELMKYSRG